MKKILVAVMVVAVGVGIAYMAIAEEETLELKAKEVETKTGPEVKVAGEGKGPGSRTKVEGTIKEGDREATVTKEAKGTQPAAKRTVLKRKVKFHSYDQDTDTITVIEEKKLVRYQTNDLDSKRPYVLRWEKEKPIEITSTYDPKLGKDVVMDAALTPLQK